jgi:hypothetical protein
VNEAYTLRQSTYPKQQAEGDLYEGVISILDSIQDQYEASMYNRHQYVLFGSKDAIQAFDVAGARGLDNNVCIMEWVTKEYLTNETLDMMVECSKWDEFMFITEKEYNEIKKL